MIVAFDCQTYEGRRMTRGRSSMFPTMQSVGDTRGYTFPMYEAQA